MKNVGTPYELSEAADAVSGIRRARQQPRRLHAEHDRVARDRARVAAVGAADHLRPSPVGTVSDAHLAAAVLGAGRRRGAVPHVARSEHDRHGDRERARGARPGRRDAHGHGVRCVVSRLRRLRAELQEHRRVLDRDGALSVRDAARLHAPATFPQNMRDLRPQSLYCEPVAARALAPARRRRLHGDGVAGRCSSTPRSTRSRCCSIATRRASIRSRVGSTEAAVRLLRSPGPARIPSPRSSCCAGSRSAGCACRSLTAAATIDGADTLAGHVGRSDRSGIRGDGARGARRPDAIRISASIPVVRPSARTTRPDGRCRCRWACAWSRSRRAARRRTCARTIKLGRPDRRAAPGGRPCIDAAQRPIAAPFDSVPGIGFDASPTAASIVPPPGRLIGTGRAILAIDPAQNNTFRAINLAWKHGAGAGVDRPVNRYVIDGLPTPIPQNAMVSSRSR